MLSKVDGSNNAWGTEYFLAAGSTSYSGQTGDAILEGWLDLGALAAGDQYQITIYEAVNGGSRTAVMPPAFATGVQASLFLLPTVIVTDNWDIGVKCTAGTNSRTLKWSLRQDDAVPTTATIASVSGAVGSVTGAVGSVTGNVGGNVVGSVASVTGNVGGNVTGSIGSVAAGGITAGSFAANAITAAKIAADATAAIAAAVFATVLEGQTFTIWMTRLFRLFGARRAGYSTVPGTVHVRDAADTKNAIDIAVTTDGWTTVTYND